MPRRIPVFFDSTGYRVYGALFAPEASGPDPRGIVLCPPFADEAVHAHRTLVAISRRLADAGLVAFLIDYAGTGDSEGSFEDGTLDRYVEDILAAAARLRAEMGVAQCGLLGLRLGANLAARAAAADPSLFPLVLWAPLADLPASFRRFLRLRLFTELSTVGRRSTTVDGIEAQLRRGEPVDVLGYSISPAMADGFLRTGPALPPRRSRATLLLRAMNEKDPDAAQEPVDGPVTVSAGGGEPFWEQARVTDQEGSCHLIVDWLRRTMTA
jgi:alpha/beta superfamily hydrolase